LLFLTVLVCTLDARAEGCEDLPAVEQVRERLLAVHGGEDSSEASSWTEEERQALACIAESANEIVVVRRRARQILSSLAPDRSCELLLRPYFSSRSDYSLTETLDAMDALIPCLGETGRWLVLREALFGSGPLARNAWRLLLGE
jgi:hypothetical protein